MSSTAASATTSAATTAIGRRQPLAHRIDDTQACASPSRPTSTATGTPSRPSSTPPRPTAPRSCGASATSSATARSPTPASRWPRPHCAICLAGNHDLAVVDVLSLEDFSRGAALAAQWTRDDDPARDARVPALALARGRRRGASGSSTPPRATRSGSTSSRGLTAELCFDADRLPRLVHRPLARRAVVPPPRGRAGDGHHAPRGRPSSTSASGEWLINPGSSRPAARRRPAGGVADARHRRVDGRVAARRLRHRGRPGRDPRRATCPTRSPSASSTGNERSGAASLLRCCVAPLARYRAGPPLRSLAGCGSDEHGPDSRRTAPTGAPDTVDGARPPATTATAPGRAERAWTRHGSRSPSSRARSTGS